MKSLQGQLLVAAPSFIGSPLPRAVVLVTEHNDDVATGVVLNHPLNEQILRSCLEMWQAGKTPAVALKAIQPQIPGLEITDSDIAAAEAEEEHCGPESHCHERGRDPHDAERAAGDDVDGVIPSAEEAAQTIQIPVGVLMAPNGFLGGRLEKKSPPLFRVVIGQVGWKNADLENELTLGHWMTTPATPDLLFAAHDDLWQLAVHRVGEQALYNGFGLAGVVAPDVN